METNKILQSDYLDLIFDNRNKTYGGYELRKHYNRRALKALGITFTVILFGVGTPFVFSQLNAGQVVASDNIMPDVTTIIDVVMPPPPPPEAPKPPEPVSAPAAVAKTVIFTEPKIEKPDVNPNLKPPDMKELENAVAGPVNNSGEGGDIAATTEKKNTGPFGTGLENTEKKGGGGNGDNNSEPVVFAEVMPEYPGGMAALMAFIRKNLNYPAAAREDDIQGRVIVAFVVNAKGEIENAKVERGIGGGCDAEALRVINAMPRWKPGKQNGHFVKVYYRLPISFKLQ